MRMKRDKDRKRKVAYGHVRKVRPTMRNLGIDRLAQTRHTSAGCDLFKRTHTFTDAHTNTHAKNKNTCASTHTHTHITPCWEQKR